MPIAGAVDTELLTRLVKGATATHDHDPGPGNLVLREFRLSPAIGISRPATRTAGTLAAEARR